MDAQNYSDMLDAILNGDEETAAVGTVIEISGQKVKAANGRFVISLHLVDQPDGEAFFQWRRLGRGGNVLARTTANHRDGRCGFLEAHARIVGLMADQVTS